MKHLITEEEYDNHDCKLSAEDGCQTCTDYFEQQGIDSDPADEDEDNG